jgi:hypothetical protein
MLNHVIEHVLSCDPHARVIPAVRFPGGACAIDREVTSAD